VRLRGWVEFDNGPVLEIATPTAIELIDCRQPSRRC
jgi:hypothetical protein